MVSSIYLPEPARILDVQQMTALEKLFTLEFFGGRSLGHQSGQFVTVSALGIGEAPISISSSPSRSNGTFELCIRKAGDLTGVLHQKKAGDTLGIRGPFGQGFPLKKFQGKDILFAPGGLGLAPARSVINQVLDERGKYGRVTILYGARTPAELLFKGELEEWDKRDDVDLHVTVDQPDDDWTGNAGVITVTFDGNNTITAGSQPTKLHISFDIPAASVSSNLAYRITSITHSGINSPLTSPPTPDPLNDPFTIMKIRDFDTTLASTDTRGTDDPENHVRECRR